MNWLTSDIHFGHQRIMEFEPERRGFLGLSHRATTEDMDEAIIERWNSQVAPDDSVLIVGDICMGQIDYSLGLISRLHGTKTLVPGNHDRMHPSMHRKDHPPEWWANRYIEAGLGIAPLQFDYMVGDTTVLVCHFPYVGGREDAHFVNFLPKDTGLPLLHGHVHSQWQRNGLMLNVGMDAHGMNLLSEDEVAAMLTLAYSYQGDLTPCPTRPTPPPPPTRRPRAR